MTEQDPRFEALLGFLRQSRGFDFTAYKRSTLMRRCFKRMQAVGAGDYEAYATYLEAHSDECQQLFDTILINVTSFFRDPGAWQFLADTILDPLLERRGAAEPLRVWSAGCSSGEEAFSLAILLAEALSRSLGEVQGLALLQRFVRIYATDVDEHALQQARQATYPAGALEPVPPGLRAKYFQAEGDAFSLRADVRHCVILSRHNLIQDPPISRLDLLVCRNTLMYFHAEAQRRIVARFHSALKDGGCLFLGGAEMLLTHSHLFRPVDLGHRVFARVPETDLRDRRVIFSQVGDESAASQLGRPIHLRAVPRHGRAGSARGAAASPHAVTAQRHLGEDPEQWPQRPAQANDELQTTNEKFISAESLAAGDRKRQPGQDARGKDST